MPSTTNSVELPTVSVVTIVRNDALRLERTIENVLAQDYPSIEYIVIDGGSTDGSIAIIRRHEARIAKWISGKDAGIYDAMNIGAGMATGEWIIFMNAGDVFVANDVLRTVFMNAPDTADIVYGNHEAKYPSFRTTVLASEPQALWKGMPCCHQSILVRTELLRKSPFSSQYTISADYQFIYSQWRLGKIFWNSHITIAEFSVDGVSEQKMIRKFWETWKVVLHEKNTLRVHCFHASRLLLAIGVAAIRAISPAAYTKVMQFRHRMQNTARRKHTA